MAEKVRRKIRDMPTTEQPMYRALNGDVRRLSDAELLAIVINMAEGLDIARDLLDHCGGVRGLMSASESKMQEVHGVGPSTYGRVQAVVELAKRFDQPDEAKPRISSPADAYALVSDMRFLEQEEMRVIVLNTRNTVLRVSTIYRGNVNTTVYRVAEIFKKAVEVNGVAIILAHNHPSGDPAPSPDDVHMTASTYKAGKLMDISLLDHMIVGGNGRWVSLKERGLGFTDE